MDKSADEPGPEPIRREAPRTNIYVAAFLVGRGSDIPITIRNLSSTGALIQSRANLEDADLVTLARGSLRATGCLVWREGTLGGLKFAEPINLSLWLPAAVIPKRRERTLPLATAPALEAPQGKGGSLTDRISAELAFVSRKLTTIRDELNQDPITAVRHATRLKDHDEATQVLGHLSELLASAEPERLLESIGMEDLRRRLECTKKT